MMWTFLWALFLLVVFWQIYNDNDIWPGDF